MMQRQPQAHSSDSKPASAHLPRRNGRQYQDVNHLLGFTLPPRAPPAPAGPRRSAKRNPGHGVFDRSRFVHQFRFVVKPDKDYTAHFADPDIHLDWGDILQVILPTSSSALSSVSTGTVVDQPFDKGASIPTCPICLSEPTAARMTKCGHVFCYPCLLHYLALADGQKWRKCPVCWDSVYAKDLKAVKWHDPVSSDCLADVTPSLFPSAEDLDHAHDTKLPTESLKMRLIRRPQISTLALPRSSTWPSEAVPPLRAPWQFTPDAFAYAKFMLAPPDYMKTELEANLKELQQEVATLRRWGVAGGTDEELGIVFVQSAMRKVEEQLEKVQALKTATVMTARKKALREIQEIQEAAGRALLGPPLPLVSETETSSSEVEADTEGEGGAAPSEYLGARSGALSGAAPAFSPASLASQALKPRPQRRNVNPPLDPEASYYFYQAASGQNIFLHPLDIKILKSHFGTYQGMPDTIEVQVEGADEGRVNEELRRRCRWLSHLPTSADLVFIEADLSKVVSKASLEPYVTPLKQRRTKRRDKARREDKAKAKSEQREQESRPIYTHSAEYSSSSYSVPLPTSIAALTSSFAETQAFPPPSALSSSPPSAAAPESTEAASRTVWGTRSFATALHASSSHEYSGAYVDEDFDERWHDFEERVGGGRNGGGRNGGSASGSNSGGGRGQETPPPSAGKKKKKGKLTLNLSGAAMRGTG